MYELVLKKAHWNELLKSIKIIYKNMTNSHVDNKQAENQEN